MSAYTVTTRPLGEAVTLCHIATERFKTARLTFLSARPADAVESPLATLHYGIMRRGCEGYPSLSALNRRMDELYGTTLTIRNRIHGDHHIISFTAEMLEDAYRLPGDTVTDILGGVTEMLSAMILRTLRDGDGLLRADAVEAEKQSLADSLRSLVNDPRAYAAEQFRRLMCDGEPYGLSIGGAPEGVAEVTPAELTAHCERALAHARCMVIYAGRASVDTVASLWDKHFGAWQPRALPPLVTRPHPVPPTPRYAEETRSVSQGKLCMGWSCGENEQILDDRTVAAMTVLNELFGVMPTSLLFRHVRETLGLCYYCESALDLTKGILWVSSGIRSDRREVAEEAIRAVFERLRAGRIDTADVEIAKCTLLDSYRQIEDSPGAVEAFLIRHMLAGTDTTPERQMAAIAAVTLADVVAAARHFSLDTVFFLRGTADGESGESDGEEEDDV